MIEFFVPGKPRPGGSKKAFLNKRTGRAILVDAANNSDWKAMIRVAARNAYNGVPLSCPLCAHMVFVLRRPKSHYRSGAKANELKESAPAYPAIRPDTTKLFRAAEDALTGILWADDALIVEQCALKRYVGSDGWTVEGVHVSVRCAE